MFRVRQYISLSVLSQAKKLSLPFGVPFAALIVIGCCALPGCVTTMPWASKTDKEPPPPPPPSFQMATKWESQVFFAPDTAHNGRPTPCLAGRMYLFGADMSQPIKADGTLSVQLIIPGQQGTGAEMMVLEKWNISNDTFCNKLGSKDKMIGWGYTLLLPWGTYNPAHTNVELAVCYTPKKGARLYSRTRIRLEHLKRPYSMSSQVQPAPVTPMPGVTGQIVPQHPGAAAPQQPGAFTPQPTAPQNNVPVLPPPTPLPQNNGPQAGTASSQQIPAQQSNALPQNTSRSKYVHVPSSVVPVQQSSVSPNQRRPAPLNAIQPNNILPAYMQHLSKVNQSGTVPVQTRTFVIPRGGSNAPQQTAPQLPQEGLQPASPQQQPLGLGVVYTPRP